MNTFEFMQTCDIEDMIDLLNVGDVVCKFCATTGEDCEANCRDGIKRFLLSDHIVPDSIDKIIEDIGNCSRNNICHYWRNNPYMCASCPRESNSYDCMRSAIDDIYERLRNVIVPC